ncbi:MAG: hypothetical protein JRN23_04105, partial [Nitrososphaerota archaeon]|nr:hypothetical protein [Nitrososphaerota archaeon]
KATISPLRKQDAEHQFYVPAKTTITAVQDSRYGGGGRGGGYGGGYRGRGGGGGYGNRRGGYRGGRRGGGGRYSSW